MNTENPMAVSKPQTMRVVAHNPPCDAQALRIETRALPECQPGQVLIKVAAFGINRPDLLQRQGLYPPPEEASPFLGLEVSGTVIETCNESTWQVGDQVCALTDGGGYGEYVAVNAHHCLPVPENMALVDAAALPEACFTVWENLINRGQLASGDTLLVHGGASGIGSVAIQLAKALGAKVVTTCGSEHKQSFCKRLGADLAINYHTEDFVAPVKAFGGADVILDMIGGDFIQKNIKVAKPEGRIVNIAFLNGALETINLMPVMLKKLTLTGSTLRSQSDQAKADIAKALLSNLWPLINNGMIKPMIDRCFDFGQVSQAHHYLETRQNLGKIVVKI